MIGLISEELDVYGQDRLIVYKIEADCYCLDGDFRDFYGCCLRAY